MKKVIFFLILIFSAQLPAAEAREPIRVYVDMIADLFHYGHVEFFKQALQYGDELVVGLNSDEDAAPYKRRPYLTLEERVRSVEGCKYVTEVLPSCPLVVTPEWIAEHKIDIVVHGDDFDTEKMKKYYSVPMRMGIFRTVPYTDGISTTEIIRRIQERA